MVNNLAIAIYGFSLVNGYQPNSNQWNRVVELFNDVDFDNYEQDFLYTEQEQKLLTGINNFVVSNEIPTNNEWKQLVVDASNIVNVMTLKLTEHIDDYYHDGSDFYNHDERFLECDNITHDEITSQHYLAQEYIDDIVYRLNDQSKEDTFVTSEILNKFVADSYMFSDTQLKLKF